MNFTIQNVLIAAVDGYDTVDVQVVNGIIAAIEPSLDASLDVIGTAINGENKLSCLPRFEEVDRKASNFP